MNGYDIIGDIHGHYQALVRLLEQLGYDRRQGYYSHPTRQAIFVGDLIDRGPQIRETVALVRRMVESGSAQIVMGNHEFNAIAYHTRHPDDPMQFLRKRIGKNVHQHFETLQQIPANELYDHLEWFRRLPMWLDLGPIRVVHACWAEPQMAKIEQARDELGGLSIEFMRQATQPDEALFESVEEVLKGTEIWLPEGMSFADKDGNVRRKARVKWYEPTAGRSLANYLFDSQGRFPEIPLTEVNLADGEGYPKDAAPVFFGHYWLSGDRPHLLADNVACLDFSVAKDGLLCAYRWDGEPRLSDSKFEWVSAGE